MDDPQDSQELSTRDKEKLLDDFLMHIDCLDELQKWTDRLNFFDVISVSSMEIRHSNFLAWLLDPHGQHGLGDYFAKKLMFYAARKSNSDNMIASLVDVDCFDLDDFYVMREAEHIDILAVSDKEKVVLVIENKIHSKEGEKQLDRYYKCVESKYPGSDYRKFYIYLTLDGDVPSNENWCPMSHEYIQSLVNTVLENKNLTDRCRIYLEDYSNTLAGELMSDEELRKTCLKIYRNHKQAIDLIIQNLPSCQSTICNRCSDIIDSKKNEGYINLTRSRTTLRFTTERIQKKVGRIGDNTWLKSNDLIAFEIYVSPDETGSGYLSFVVGPGKPEDRKAWYDYFNKVGICDVKKNKMSKNWTSIQIVRFSKDKDSDDVYIDRAVNTVNEYLKTIKKLEDIIEKGPDTNPENCHTE